MIRQIPTNSLGVPAFLWEHKEHIYAHGSQAAILTIWCKTWHTTVLEYDWLHCVMLLTAIDTRAWEVILSRGYIAVLSLPTGCLGNELQHRMAWALQGGEARQVGDATWHWSHGALAMPLPGHKPVIYRANLILSTVDCSDCKVSIAQGNEAPLQILFFLNGSHQEGDV